MSRRTADSEYTPTTSSPYKIFPNYLSGPDRTRAREFIVSHFHRGLTHTEFVVLTAIYDRTIVFGKMFECIKQRHIHQGLSTMNYETQPYPISRKSVGTALESLQRRGYILGFRFNQDANGNPIHFYGINFMFDGQRSSLAVLCWFHLRHALENGLDFINYTNDPTREWWNDDEYFTSLQQDAVAPDLRFSRYVSNRRQL